MKNIYFFVVLCLSALPAFSQSQRQETQSSSVDPRIVEVFGDQLQQLVLNDPQRLKDLNDILNKRAVLMTEPYSAKEKYPNLDNAPLFNNYNPALVRDTAFDRSTFNVLKYNLQFFTPIEMVYRIGKTDTILVIYPQKAN